MGAKPPGEPVMGGEVMPDSNEPCIPQITWRCAELHQPMGAPLRQRGYCFLTIRRLTPIHRRSMR
jgi:hypothetical protein